MPANVTVLTACLNNAATIEDCLRSRQQHLPGALHLIQDGGSTDGSVQRIEALADAQTELVSGPDDGLYDALNRLVARVQTDWLLFLHADDRLVYPDLLADIAEAEAAGAPAIACGVAYVNEAGRVYRSWKLGGYRSSAFRRGYMLPHPGLVLRRELFERYGPFRLDLGTAGDYEWILRVFYKGGEVPLVRPGCVLTHMRGGGASNASVASRLQANRNDRLAWTVNDLRPPALLRFMKPGRKLGQFLGM